MLAAESPEELADLMGADAEVFAKTPERFNAFVANGEGLAFERNPETMCAFEGIGLYAPPLQPAVLNTQGSPRRNSQAQVLNCL